MKHRKLRKWREFPPEFDSDPQVTLAPVDIWGNGSRWHYVRRTWHAGDRQWVAYEWPRQTRSLQAAKEIVNTMGKAPRFNFGDFLEMAE